ncbi:MAG: hypothetical protein J7M13_00870 [Synergistetes bacterium]|nr:hypothetical protein [Synergistota bacterium]
MRSSPYLKVKPPRRYNRVVAIAMALIGAMGIVEGLRIASPLAVIVGVLFLLVSGSWTEFEIGEKGMLVIKRYFAFIKLTEFLPFSELTRVERYQDKRKGMEVFELWWGHKGRRLYLTPWEARILESILSEGKERGGGNRRA